MPKARPPNILWILADELRAAALGVEGASFPGMAAPRVATPAIDALAAQGTRFSRHYCNSPACVPARTSQLTCRAPERTGVYGNEGAWLSFPLPVRHRSFPEHFAQAGHATACFGKSHVHADYRVWQHENGDGGEMDVFTNVCPVDRLDPIVPDGIPGAVGGVFPGDLAYPPEAVTRNAVDWLAAAGRDRPFLMCASYLQPHTPVFPPALLRALYPAAEWPGHDQPRGYGSLYEQTFAEIVGGRRLSHEQMQRAQADYHALVTWLDLQVGLLMTALERFGLAEDTIVVFTSDHGASLGENGLLAKVVHAPQSQRVPLILRAPGRVPEGRVDDSLSEALDLGRTLCALAGIDPDPEFEGRALLHDPAPEAVHSVIGYGGAGTTASSAANVGTWPDGRGWPRRACLRTQRFRFDMNVRQDGGPVLPENEDMFLADSLADPAEHRNLAADPAHAETVARFRDMLLARTATALEPDFVPAYSPAEVGAFAPPPLIVQGRA